MLGRDLHSNYGPTADTGGLMQNHAPTIYAYASLDALLDGERLSGTKRPLPARPAEALTERPAEGIRRGLSLSTRRLVESRAG